MTDAGMAELLDRVDRLPWGRARLEAALALLAAAQERGDVHAEFQARLRLTDEGAMSGHTELALTNFAWCIAKYKEDPARFGTDGGDGRDRLLWQYKWMPGTLMQSPAFPLAQVDDVLDDFEATFRAAGVPLSAVVCARFETALNARDLPAAERWGAELAAMPRDAYSSCAACTPANYVALELLRGNDAAAAKLALRIWKSGDSCADEPESLLASALVALLRAGKTKKALQAFHYAYEESRNDRDDLRIVSGCAQFAAVTGNELLALAMLESHLPWLTHDALGESDHLEALRCFGVVLSRLELLGHGEVVVRGSGDAQLASILSPTEAPRTVAEMAAACWEAAERLTAAFDERNGNDGHARLLAAARALVEQSYPIDIDDDAGLAYRPMLVRAVQPASPEDWLERALDHRWAGEHERALAAVSIAAAGLEGRLLARALGLQRSLAEMLGEQELHASTQAQWELAIERAYGKPTLAFTMATLHPLLPGDIDDALAANPGAHPGYVAAAWGELASVQVSGEVDEERVRAAAGSLDNAIGILRSLHGHDAVPARTLASALLFRGQLLASLGQHEEAAADLAEAEELASTRLMRAVVIDTRAQVAARLGAFEEAAALHDDATSLAAAAGHAGFAAEAAGRAGAAWIEEGEPREAAARLAYAMSLQAPGTAIPIGLRWRYALASIESDDAATAAVLLAQILEEERAAGGDGWSIGDTVFQLGRALEATYDDACVERFLEARDLFAAAGDSQAASVASLSAARALQLFSRPDEAAATAQTALDALDALDAEHPPAIEVDLLLAKASALAWGASPGWQAAFDEAVRVAGASGDELLAARAQFLRLSALDDEHERPDVAERVVALAADVATLMRELGDQARAAAALHWKVSALLTLERTADAEALMADAAMDESLEPAVRSDFAARLADHLRSLGRSDEAARWKAYRKRLED